MLEFSNEENKVFHGEEVGRRQTRKQIRCSVMALVRNAETKAGRWRGWRRGDWVGVPEGRVSNRGMCRFFQSLVWKHCPSYIISLTERRAAAPVSRTSSEPPLTFPLCVSHLGWPLPALDIVLFLPLEGPFR